MPKAGRTIPDSTPTGTRNRSTRRPAVPDAPPLPPPPPRTAEEQQASADFIREMQELTRELRQRNLGNAVRLAQQALGGGGTPELQAHFAELGRRFGHTLGWTAKKPGPNLRVIAGGAA